MINILSLFSGAGGLDLGFENTGWYKIIASLESNETYMNTLNINKENGVFKDSLLFNVDISSPGSIAIVTEKLRKEKIDGVIGGPPCEAFSVRGAKNGLSDPRGRLLFDFVRWATHFNPTFILMENVPPLVKFDDGKIINKICGMFYKEKYNVVYGVLNAAQFGAPTRRKRLILIASKTPIISMPSPTHSDEENLASNGLAPATTVRTALSGLESPSHDENKFPTWHRLINHTESVVNRFDKLRQGQQDNIRKRTRLHLDKPSPTVIAGDLRGTRSHIHPTEPRELTNREVARIQGFPDTYQFSGNRNEVCKQIANAVPVQFAEALARSIFRQISNNGIRNEEQ